MLLRGEKGGIDVLFMFDNASPNAGFMFPEKDDFACMHA